MTRNHVGNVMKLSFSLVSRIAPMFALLGYALITLFSMHTLDWPQSFIFLFVNLL